MSYFDYSYGTTSLKDVPDQSHLILSLHEQEKGTSINQLDRISFLMSSKTVKILTVHAERQDLNKPFVNLLSIVNQFAHFSSLKQVIFDIPIKGETFKELAAAIDKDFNTLSTVYFKNIQIEPTKESEYLEVIDQYKNRHQQSPRKRVIFGCQLTKQEESMITLLEDRTKTETVQEIDLKEIPEIKEIITDKSEQQSHLLDFSSKNNSKIGPTLLWSAMNEGCILLKYLICQYKENPTAEKANFIIEKFSLSDFKLKLDNTVKKPAPLNFFDTLFRSFSSPSSSRKKTEETSLTIRASSTKEPELKKNISIFKQVFKKGPLFKEDSFIENNLINIESCVEIKKEQKVPGDVDFFAETESNMLEVLQQSLNSYEKNSTVIHPHEMDVLFKVQMKRFCSEAQKKAGFTFPKLFIQAFFFMTKEEESGGLGPV